MSATTLQRLGDAELFDWLRLCRSDNVGPRTFGILLARHGSARAAIAALPRLAARGGSKPVVLAAEAGVAREIDAARRAGATILPSCDPAYPEFLREIDAPPAVLVVRGAVEVLSRPCIAIVGSRNASASGLVITERFARGFGAAGFCVVSGLARGIDKRAHDAALATGTIAVLAGGHDRLYPPEHTALAETILGHGGAVVSEMPFGWEPRGRDFPRRNRIVSGLSYGVVVVEAAQRSGSLITARFALEQNRGIFAVPGSPLDPRAEGTNDLIRRDGAALCTDPEHVLSGIEPPKPPDPSAPRFAWRDRDTPAWEEGDLDESDPDGETAIAERRDPAGSRGPEPDAGWHAPAHDASARLLGLIGPSPIEVDDLIRESGLPTAAVRAALIDLEMDDRIVRMGANRVALRVD